MLHRSWSDLQVGDTPSRSVSNQSIASATASADEDSFLTPCDDGGWGGAWPVPTANPASTPLTGENAAVPVQQKPQLLEGKTKDAQEWLVNPSRYNMLQNIGQVRAQANLRAKLAIDRSCFM